MTQIEKASKNSYFKKLWFVALIVVPLNILFVDTHINLWSIASAMISFIILFYIPRLVQIDSGQSKGRRLLGNTVTLVLICGTLLFIGFVALLMFAATSIT